MTGVSFGPDGRTLASVSFPNFSGGRHEAIVVWDLASGRRRPALEARRVVVAWAFSADGRLLAMAGPEPRKVELREMPSGRPVGATIVLPAPTYAIAVSPDARLVATVADGRILSVWSAATGRELLRLDGQDEALQSLAFSPDGRTLAAAGGDGDIRLWDLDRLFAAVDRPRRDGPRREALGPAKFHEGYRRIVDCFDELMLET